MDEVTLKAAFLPFGDITDVQIPLDPASKGVCRVWCRVIIAVLI